MQTATKQLWASALAAIAGSLCCVAPLVLTEATTGAGFLSKLIAKP